MLTVLNIAFIAAIVTLFLANMQLKEIRQGKTVFGNAPLTKPRDKTSIKEYASLERNITPLRRYFYWRNLLKVLFGMFCISGALYLALIALSLVQIEPASAAVPLGENEKKSTVTLAGNNDDEDDREFAIDSFFIAGETPSGEVEAFQVRVAEDKGQLVWLSGNGTLTEINIGTAFQLFGVLTIFLGIATVSVATAIREAE